ncbi:unnamed protein product [Pieris brassicae]|uniref:Uncharacterized protein n=1 Tax=Pieris brassicae TaxID=7116 RepID=A0A9P0XDI9_PIEBR|nr:unnamed protein product [Pieris brassicae]
MSIIKVAFCFSLVLALQAVNCQMGCNCGPYPIIYREKSNDLDVILPILMLAMMDDGPFGAMPPMPLPYAGMKNNGGCGCGGYRR